MNKILEKIKEKKMWALLGIALFAFVTLNMFNVGLLSDAIKKIFGGQKEIKSVIIESDGYSKNEGGAYHIEKSADWTSKTTAKVHFDVDTIMKTDNEPKDILFVLDISGSMAGAKLDRVKQDSKELVESLLSNADNKAALITFDSTSTILSDFTNDKDKLLDLIDNLEDTGCTNYNQALINADKVLENYQPGDNRGVILLFLTDGYPNEETPNEIIEYELLKSKYPYLTINGIQYEMGTEIVKDLINISDSQFHADMETLNNVLFDASVSPEFYEDFEIVDWIANDYFEVLSEEDIRVSLGTVKLENIEGKQKITWTIPANTLKTGSSMTMDINLKLKEKYVGNEGFYPTNEKEEVTAKLFNEKEKHQTSKDVPVLQAGYKVYYDANYPDSCKQKYDKTETHYAFENVEISSDEPPACSGYLFKGWTFTSDVKKINDDYFQMPTHDVHIKGIWTNVSIDKNMDGTVYEELNLYKTVQKNGKEYTGEGPTGTRDTVYFSNTTNNNVLFADTCWKIVRTTETGGVKLVYNGVPQEEKGVKVCTNTGDAQQLPVEIAFNSQENSPAYVGYMYNTIYPSNSKVLNSTTSILSNYSFSSPAQTNYYYSSTITYDTDSHTYHLGADAVQHNWLKAQTGYYTCNSTSTTCSTAYYIVGKNSYNMYSLQLSSGHLLEDANTNVVLGKGIQDIGNGNVILTDTLMVKKTDWYQNHDNYKNYYVCNNDLTASTCSRTDVRYITDTSWISATVVQEITYGKSFTYSNGIYTLKDTFSTFDITKEKSELNTHHYTCANNGTTCTSINYIFYFDDKFVNTLHFYITISDGKGVQDALNEMLFNDDVNAKDSTIKTAVDTWYEENIKGKPAELMLEDAIWCNDRSIYELNGWDPNGEGNVSSYLQFYSYQHRDLTCKNKNDRFTVNSSIGNGKLKYPVGLLTAGEADLAGATAMKTGSLYWLLTPRTFYYSTTSGYRIFYTDGSLDYINLHFTEGVRPAVSLKPGVGYSSGDGSTVNPYVIEEES